MLLYHDIACFVLQVLGLDGFGKLIDAAVVAALMSLHALRLSYQTAGRFPRDAASPTADTIRNLLSIVQSTNVVKEFVCSSCGTAEHS